MLRVGYERSAYVGHQHPMAVMNVWSEKMQFLQDRHQTPNDPGICGRNKCRVNKLRWTGNS